MVLAAGFGERMRPITLARAKPAIPLLNRPLILRTLDYLKRQGVSEVVINLHHHPDSIRRLVRDGGDLGLTVHYSEEPEILGTSGGLGKAAAHFRGAGTFIMINSDFFIDGSLEEALRGHRDSGALATMVLVPADRGSAYGTVEMSKDGVITRISGRPASSRPAAGDAFTFTGIHLLQPELLDRIPPGVASGINRDIYPPLIGTGGSIRGHVHRGRWLEFGTPRLLLDGSLRLLGEWGDPLIAPLRREEGVYLDRVELPGDIDLVGPLLAGRGSSIGAGVACRGGVIIGERVSIGTGSTLDAVIVMEGARVGSGARLKECVIDSGAEVPDGADVARRVVIAGPRGRDGSPPLEPLGGGWMAEI